MKKIILCIVLFTITILTKAQNAGDVDPAFVIGNSFNKTGSVTNIAIKTDGKIIAGGSFYEVNGVYPTNNIVQLNANGTTDLAFSLVTREFIARAIQTDGKIVIGTAGYSSTIARYNADGSPDGTFAIGRLDSPIYSIAIQADGKILAGGLFNSYNNNYSYRHIIRFNTDGTVDTTFISGSGFSGGKYGPNVKAVVVQPDGKIIIGGDFTTYNGVTVNGIVRLNTNGTTDLSGVGCNGTVNSVVLQADGKALVAGSFTTFAGLPYNNIVRLNADATVDASFVVGAGFDNEVNTMLLQPDGKVVVGGSFSTYNATTSNKIIKLNANGSVDTGFATGTGFNDIVSTLAIQSDGQLLVGGSFNFYNGAASRCLVRLKNNGSKDATFNTEANSFNTTGASVQKAINQPDGKILVGGSFSSYFGIPANNIVRLNNADGSIDTSFKSGTGFIGTVNTLALQTDGKIIAAGNLISYNGVFASSIVRLKTDGTIDPTFNAVIGYDFYNIRSIAIQADGKILIGGNFYKNNFTIANKILRLNSNGSVDITFKSADASEGTVNSVAIVAGKIYIGGNLVAYNGSVVNDIARLNEDGTLDTTFKTGTGFGDASGQVFSILVQANGKILVGGSFTSYNGTAAKNIISLNTDGTIDTAFAFGTGFKGNYVLSLVQQSNGKIIAGGSFSEYNGTAISNIARLNTDGSIDSAFNSGTGFNSTVKTLLIESDEKIVAGGDFNTYKDSFGKRIMRLKGDGALATQSFNKTALTLYPNPVKDKLSLTVDANTAIHSYEIIDLLGKKVQSKSLQQNQIDVSELSKGIYVIKLNTSQGLMSSKFIKE